jgi:hypothetical protein
MPNLGALDLASRTPPMADEKRKPKTWKPGGRKGKLHDELGIPKDEKIPEARLSAAAHSDNPEIRRDAIRAETMKGWDHGGAKKKPSGREAVYDHPRSQHHREQKG